MASDTFLDLVAKGERPEVSRGDGMSELSATALAIAILAVAETNRSMLPQSAVGTPGSSFVQVAGSSLYYEECGTGADAVVMLHDGIVHSAVWDGIWPAFCQRFHTVRYDRRGYGRSPVAGNWYSETDDLATILQHAGVTRATLVGSSHGGEIALNFTLAHPELVRRLVLVGPVVGGLPYTEHFFARAIANSELLRKGDVPGGLKAWANDRYLIAPGNDAARKRLLELLIANPQDMTHSDQILPPRPALPRLGEIHVPTLILVGDADIPDVHAHAGAIEAGIPRAQRMVIVGTGHIMYLEKPDQFAQIVMRFMDTNPY
jgi:pimeloyl-ACP methyl ester carboxylesterase